MRRAAHHGCGLSRDVTTKSVRSVPQLEQRNLRRVNGTSPRPLSIALQIGLRLVLAAAFAPDEQRDVARSQRGPWRRQAVAVAAIATAPGYE